jgi:exonuclease III
VPSNVVKYDGKTNPSVWLEDYHLAGKASETVDDLFIIQLLPMYLADSARAITSRNFHFGIWTIFQKKFQISKGFRLFLFKMILFELSLI